jgi:hypothetical protein
MKRAKGTSQRREKKKTGLPDVVPPRSVVRLVRSDAKTPLWKQSVGRVFRIGYYNRRHGLDFIWLVSEGGEFELTANRALLLKYFEVIEISDETDFYGDHKPPLGPLRSGKSGK